MCAMERCEPAGPALVPQWYKLNNGSTSSNGWLNHSSNSSSTPRNSDENAIGFSSRNSLFSDPDRKSSSLRRSFSSNGTISGKSQPYGSFRRSNREKNQDKSFHSRKTDNKSILIDDGLFDHDDFYIGARIEKVALRRSNSMTTERQGDTLPKRMGSTVNNSGSSGVSMLIGAGKTAFEKDFPSLVAEERQGNSNVGCISSLGLKTAVQSLPVGPPVIIGTSALAEVPITVELNELGPSSTLQPIPLGQVPVTSSATNSLNMAEALAQPPSQAWSTQQSSIGTQRIEELTLRKCKQLIPVTPSMPKTLICNAEKGKSKGSRAAELSAVNKVGQQSAMQILNQTIPSSARPDTAKPPHSGTLQVLNREKNGISTSNKDALNFVKVLNPAGLVSPAPMSPLKSSVDQKLKADYKSTAVSSTQSSFSEKKPLSQARDRNDFFNLIRKKSSENSNTLTGPKTVVCSFTVDSVAQNSHTTSFGNSKEESLSAVFTSKFLKENGACANGDFHASDEPELLENEETCPFSDLVEDPEEEAFLQSLGWDKNMREEALTKEEIDAFLKKYEKKRPKNLCFSSSMVPA